MERQKKELFPTLKVDAKSENELDVQFSEEHEQSVYEIMRVADVPTKFNDKIVITLKDGDTNYNVFVNAKSNNNLIDAFGKDDKRWIGQFVKLSLEKDKKFNKHMIVISKA